jgi:hypothetical protein
MPLPLACTTAQPHLFVALQWHDAGEAGKHGQVAKALAAPNQVSYAYTRWIRVTFYTQHGGSSLLATPLKHVMLHTQL